VARRAAIYAAGELDATRVRAGELARVVTALCLHADPAHAIGNAIATAIFVSAAGDWIGPGLALLLTLLSGAIGNSLAAALDASHRAIGFSTATFGALGLSAVFGFVARYRDHIARRRAWLVLGAGVALLALLGAGERSDLLAHLLGLGAGGALGAGIARMPRRTVRAGGEIAMAALALLLVAASWILQLRRA
jgi:membrane associated rhomboid family serine protease